MRISAQFGRRALGAAALLFGLAFAGIAQAVPIYVYTFELTGFGGSSATAGVVKGSFSGATDSGGHINKNTLTSFHFESSGFTGLLSSYNWSSNSVPHTFSYIPGDTGSFTLFDYDTAFPLFTACIGSTVSFLCGGGAAKGALAQALLGPGIPGGGLTVAATNSVPVLNGFMVDIGDPVFMTPTPVPASLLLFATALVGVAGLGAFRRRRVLQA